MSINSSVRWLDQVTGLIFDLDGVLIQSSSAHARAFQEVLSGCGIHDFDYGDFAGWRTAEVFRAVLRDRYNGEVSDALIADCSQRKSRRARDLIAAERPMESDCVPVIRELASRYRLVLASSGSRRSVDAFLDSSGLADAFRFTFSGDDVGNAKPDPEIFRRSISALEAQPRECAVIEDAVAGILAARRAGAHSIGFGTKNAQALSLAGAGRVVGSLRELAGLFERA
ncbi:MAG TPA: HAD family phosphatase [Bryobacteraceae bacterium]|nr:HAD family phosphatase [Bryobacteraceae bacterium]